MQHTERRLHMLYICGILILIIVGFVSYIAVESDPQGSVLMSYVSFASTLTSIILSVLAIIYTMISNSKGDSYITKLDQTSASIDKSSENLNDMSLRLEETLKKLVELPERIDKSSEHLKRELDSKLGEFQHVVNETKQEVRETRTEILKSISPSSPPSDTISDGIVHSFLSTSSFLGLLGLLACVLAKENDQRTFRFQNIFEEEERAIYLHGYLIACSAFGLIEVDYDNNSLIINNVYNIHKVLTREHLLEYLKGSPYAKSNQEEYQMEVDRVLNFFEAK